MKGTPPPGLAAVCAPTVVRISVEVKAVEVLGAATLKARLRGVKVHPDVTP